jgi:SprT protein
MSDARQQLFFDFVRLVAQPGKKPEIPTPVPAPALGEHRPSGIRGNRPPPQIRGRLLDGALTELCRELVLALGLDDLGREVRVYWNSRLSTTAGLAHHYDSIIDLNPRLLEFQPDEPDRTMRHELAHLVAQQRAGRRRIQPHGTQWQRACAELGIPGESRCHDLPLERRRVRRKFAYQCRHCGVVVPRVRRLARHSSCYACCQNHNQGRYSSKFLLLAIPLDEAKILAPDASW